MPSNRNFPRITMIVLAATLWVAPVLSEPPDTSVVAERTLRLAVTVDARGARLQGLTEIDTPFIQDAQDQAHSDEEPRAHRPVHSAEVLKFVLVDEDGHTFTRKLVVPGLCLIHEPTEPPHIQGDTIRLHRETVIVELPAVDGYRSLEVQHVPPRSESSRLLAKIDLRREAKRLEEADPVGNGAVTWPAAGEPTYQLWGEESETSERINVVIVPDGYKTSEKSTMIAHAQGLVDKFRATTPYQEHDKFFNYILVFAYSNDSGTTQCDCDLLRNTAMATSFPKVVDTCADSANRCLYYTKACNPAPAGVNNIAAAELRAPAHDTTIVMVNTSRYGGCGGYRAVYSAAVTSADLIAIHELGHSLARLADEYGGADTCGTVAGEINTSTNSKDGAWSEWIADIGAPRESAQYHDKCIYRPEEHCMMRTLGPPFCHVCNQQWALQIFGNPRVAGTAPIESVIPGTNLPVAGRVGIPATFVVQTRLGTGTTNETDWQITGPCSHTKFHPGNDQDKLVATFACAGAFQVTVQVTADTNFIKPSQYGSNQESRSWTVNVN